MINGLITMRPTKPQTTEGIAASNSMVIFRNSRVLPLQNSETKIAAPSPKGTARPMAMITTLPVPRIRARAP